MKTYQLCIDHGIRIMKISFIQLTIVAVFSGITYAEDSYGQDVLDNKVTVELKDISLSDALKHIESEANVRFAYSQEFIDINQSISVSVQGEKLSEVLKGIFTPLKIEYEVIGGQIVLKRQIKSVEKISRDFLKTGETTSPNTLLKMPIIYNHLSYINLVDKSISGKVTDENGEGLPGVNILVKGTTTGTVTDVAGNYRLNVPDDATSLVFSSVGYTSEEITIGGRLTIDVQMVPDVQALSEIVVVGYGTQRRSDVTGSVGSVKSDELEKRPTVNPLDALAGKVAGLSISNNSGRPGGNMRVNIRGFNSIGASNNPLYVIDGIIGANIESLNPNDIASIDVLKDASATAIYGARGANGVIIVTTKQASEPGLNINYSGNVSVGEIARKFDMQNSEQYMQWLERAWEYDPNRGQFPKDQLNDYYPDLFDANGNPLYDTDWQDAATQTAVSQRHYLSVTGGSDKFKQGLYLGYQKEEGIMLNTYYKKLSARYTSEMEITPWFTLNGSLAYNKINQNKIDEYRVGALTATRSMIEAHPIFPVRYPDGRWGRFSDFGFNFNPDGSFFPAPIYQAENPVRLMEEVKWIFDNNQILVNLQGTFKLTDDLELKSTFSSQIFDEKNNLYVGKNILDLGAPVGGIGQIGYNKEIYWQTEHFLTYNKTLADDHTINALLGATWSERSSEGVLAGATGFATDFYEYNKLDAGAVRSQVFSNFEDSRLNSYFGRFNYSYKSKYLATFTGRYDGASVFGPDNKYAFFPSGALGWIVSNEGFLNGSNLISNLKLRGSYGLTGNSGIAPYSSLGTLSNYNVVLNDQRVIGTAMGRVPNPGLEWEKTTQADIGIDLGLFDNRVNIIADYYHKKTTDLLLAKPISIVTGFTDVTDNIGSVKNTGFELTLNAGIIESADFNWDFNITYAANQNEILALGANDEDIFPGPNFLGQTNILQVGESVGNIWGFQRIGTWSENEADEAAKYGRRPGDIKREDVNGDFRFDNADARVLGNMFPDYEMLISTSIRYKNFDLGVEVQVVQGNEVVNITTLVLEDRQHYANSYATLLEDAWTPQHQNTEVPAVRLAHVDPLGTDLTFFMDSRWVEDGSFIRGRNISLGYTFPLKLTQSIGIADLRVYANAQNFFLISDYRGHDPEISTFNNNAFGQGVEFFGYPKPRTYTFGVNLTF